MKQFQVNKQDVTDFRLVEDSDAPLGDSGIALEIERFAFTANNLTYFVVGDKLGYWQFFPAIKNEDKNTPAYKKYFMHGTSHHLGLDTHDYGLLHEPMQANMVFTVEPGIYIPEEGFGIRLEDDVVIKATGAPFNLMQNIPIDADEIEELMNS